MGLRQTLNTHALVLTNTHVNVHVRRWRNSAVSILVTRKLIGGQGAAGEQAEGSN